MNEMPPRRIIRGCSWSTFFQLWRPPHVPFRTVNVGTQSVGLRINRRVQ